MQFKVSIVIVSLFSFLIFAGFTNADGRTPAPSVLRYEDFGAVGDGKTDDHAAIIKAHAEANRKGLPVRANDTATYYIGGKDQTAIIETDTDWGKAKFIIDDRKLEDRRAWVFEVRSALPPMELKGLKSLKAGQARLENAPGRSAVVCVTDDRTKRYIRKGLNQNSGKAQTDVFLVGADGVIDSDTPVVWDFDRISKVEVYPVDKERLTLRGGHFTTIANAAEPKYHYHTRGIQIRRSNVLVVGLEHHIEGEGKQGAPYGGFLNIRDCANVTVKDTGLSGHKTYTTIGAAGKSVSMGTYDLLINRAMNVSIVNCRQLNDIHDRSRWGIMASNYSKNLLYDGCTLSRFDAHMGVANATIKNSTIGHAGINLIGSGKFLLEKSTVHSTRLINLRQDYGSTWQGELVIRNSRFKPIGGGRSWVHLIIGHNDGTHDFGYTCYLPERVVIDELEIADDKGGGKRGLWVFGNFNPKFKPGYVEKFPYIKPREVTIRKVKTESGRTLELSSNKAMFAGVKVTRE